jgi:WD40 repeat protein
VGREVASLAASGEWLALAFNRNIEFWSATTLKMEKSLGGDPPLTAHAETITALAALNEDRLASASMDMTIKIWNTLTGLCEVTLQGHGDIPCTLARLRSDWLASGSMDRTIRLWNPSSGECTAAMSGHGDSILGLVALGDGQHLASGSADTTIRIWNAAAGKCIATLKGHTRAVTALAELSEECFASGSRDKTVQIWMKRDDGWHGTVLFVADAEITALVFVRGLAVLVASDGSGRVHFLKVKDFELASGDRRRH